jgi:hypothetical protein
MRSMASRSVETRSCAKPPPLNSASITVVGKGCQKLWQNCNMVCNKTRGGRVLATPRTRKGRFSANSWGRRWRSYPRFCCMPPSLSPRCGGRSWPAGRYPASPSRRRCEQAGWYKRPRAPTDKPAPRTLLPIGQRSRLAADIAADAGEAFTSPFHPLPGEARRDCSLLPSCVAGGLRRPRPRLRFRGVAFQIWARGKGEGAKWIPFARCP